MRLKYLKVLFIFYLTLSRGAILLAPTGGIIYGQRTEKR